MMSTLRMGPNHTVEMCLCIGGFIVHLFVITETPPLPMHIYTSSELPEGAGGRLRKREKELVQPTGPARPAWPPTVSAGPNDRHTASGTR